MPELPEVETVRRGLEKALKGETIHSVSLRRANLRIPFPKNFAKILQGRTIASIERRAKYLLFTFDSDDILIAHLGMSGNFLLSLQTPKTFSKHDHVVMDFGSQCLIFNDPRRFGLLTLTTKKDLAKHKLLAQIGPDAFDKNFSAAYLKKSLLARSTPVKIALMDQKLVAGVGNIYASEALYLAKINPTRRARDVAQHAAALIKSTQNVLSAAIASGGSSLRDFMQVSGEGGYFQHSFNVYGRAGKPCNRCKTPISEIRQGGRSTYFCPHCQK